MKKLIEILGKSFLIFFVFIVNSIIFLLYATVLGPHFFKLMYDHHIINTQIPDSDAINYCLYSLLSVMLLIATVVIAFKNEIEELVEKV